MKKLIILSLLLIGTSLAFTGCESMQDNSAYVNPDFPPAQMVKQPTP